MAKDKEKKGRRRGFNLKNPDNVVRTVAGLAGAAVALEPVVGKVLYPGQNSPAGWTAAAYKPPATLGEGVGRAVVGLKESAKTGQMVAALLPSAVAEGVIGAKKAIKRAAGARS